MWVYVYIYVCVFVYLFGFWVVSLIVLSLWLLCIFSCVCCVAEMPVSFHECDSRRKYDELEEQPLASANSWKWKIESDVILVLFFRYFGDFGESGYCSPFTRRGRRIFLCFSIIYHKLEHVNRSDFPLQIYIYI